MAEFIIETNDSGAGMWFISRLIRCKDCKYWQDNNDGYPHDDCKWNHDETPDEDDYCSGGERKEETEC